MGSSDPSPILFAQNLPPECNHQMLQVLFQQCIGLVDLRIVPAKGMAFIEFGDQTQAGMALRQLNGFQITESVALNLSYSK